LKRKLDILKYYLQNFTAQIIAFICDFSTLKYNFYSIFLNFLLNCLIVLEWQRIFGGEWSSAWNCSFDEGDDHFFTSLYRSVWVYFV